MSRKKKLTRVFVVLLILLSFAIQVIEPANVSIAKAASEYVPPKGSDKAVYQSGLDLSKKKGTYYTTEKETYIDTTRFVIYLDKGVEVPVNIIELLNSIMNAVEKETGYKFYVKHFMDREYWGMDDELGKYFSTANVLKKVNPNHEKIEIVVPNKNRIMHTYASGENGLFLSEQFLNQQNGTNYNIIMELLRIVWERNGSNLGYTLEDGFVEYYTELISKKYPSIKSTYDSTSRISDYENLISEDNMENLFTYSTIGVDKNKLGYRIICYIIEKYGKEKLLKLRNNVTDKIQAVVPIPMGIVVKEFKSELSKNFFVEFAKWHSKNLKRFGDKDMSIYGDWYYKDGSLYKYFGKDKNVVVPKSADNIDYYAFTANVTMETIELPSTLKYLPTFENCVNLKKINIPDSITVLSGYSFYGCSSLKEVIFPKKITEIGPNEFTDCTALTEINIPEGITTIGTAAFLGCTSLKKVTLPSTLKEMNQTVFYGCTSLESIVIPNGVEILSPAIFSGCTNLKSIKLPKNLKEIDFSVFWNCSSLKKIILPDELTKIGDSAFNFSGLTSIEIPGKVTEIGDFAFGSNKSLKKIYIPKSVKSIGENAFYNCVGFTIYGEKGSYAETYAKNHGYIFEVIKAAESNTKVYEETKTEKNQKELLIDELTELFNKYSTTLDGEKSEKYAYDLYEAYKKAGSELFINVLSQFDKKKISSVNGILKLLVSEAILTDSNKAIIGLSKVYNSLLKEKNLSGMKKYINYDLYTWVLYYKITLNIN